MRGGDSLSLCPVVAGGVCLTDEGVGEGECAEESDGTAQRNGTLRVSVVTLMAQCLGRPLRTRLVLETCAVTALSLMM